MEVSGTGVFEYWLGPSVLPGVFAIELVTWIAWVVFIMICIGKQDTLYYRELGAVYPWRHRCHTKSFVFHCARGCFE